MAFSIVILAAGQGKRMRSALPKVLHPLAGKSLLEHVIATAETLHPNQPPIVIYGHQGDKIKTALAHANVTWIEQSQQLGTGHAVQQALSLLNPNNSVLVLSGDVPLISSGTLQHFVENTPANALGLITMSVTNPKGLGRIIRGENNRIVDIIEEKDATVDQLAIQEINAGIYLIPVSNLVKWLPQLQNQNAQGEYYLTDIIKMAVTEKIPIHGCQPTTEFEILGINDRRQLATLERFYQQQIADKLLEQGVTLRDPARLDVRGDISVGRDVMIDINVILEGRVIIGNECIIGPHVILRNVILGDRVEIKANSIVDGTEISADCIIGPFARIRPGTTIATKAHIGNFVEIKNSEINEGSKVNHLTYIGDSDIGKHVNVGAGTITCNYDGTNKHRTVIADGAFIGSNTSLIAPVTIGEGAYIATASTITRDAPAHQLTICRAREQRSIANWQRPKKKES